MTFSDSMVSQVIFHPRGEEPGYTPTGLPTMIECGEAQVGGYLHLSLQSDDLLLFFHGNGEIASEYDDLSALYTGMGLSFWVLDYRGYGRSSGSPSYERMFADAERICEDVPRIGKLFGRQFRKILVMGRSLGSASAIHLASVYPDVLTGLLLDSPFADGLALIARLGGPPYRRPDLLDFQDNLDKIRLCKMPTLIIHGNQDWIIPVSEAQALYTASPSEKKRLVVIEGAGHNDLLWVGYAQYAEALKDIIQDLNIEKH